MGQVLGFVIDSAIKNYGTLCSAANVAPRVQWPTPTVFKLRRYRWDMFAQFISEFTVHCREFGIEPLEFQRLNIPVLFRFLYAARFYRRIVTPRNLLKMIDTWSGPFIFRCGTSIFKDLDADTVQIKIELHDGYAGSRAFFEHCVAGMISQLEMMNFNESVAEVLTLSETSLDVVFHLQSLEGAPAISGEKNAATPIENFLFWLDDFELGIVSAESDPGRLLLAETSEHIRVVATDLGPKRKAILDSLTIISSRLQLSSQKGWETVEGRREQSMAAAQCQLLRQLCHKD